MLNVPSKSQANKVAKQLVANQLSVEERRECIATVANFRSSYHYPLRSMIGYFRKAALQNDKKAVVVSRLKRIPSIINKLRRHSNMQISTMGDIGGIRIITRNLAHVHKIHQSITSGRSKNILQDEKDYLSTPKSSGYRGIHLVYSYQGAKQNYHGMRVELQIRSTIQHAWATAVEVVGIFKHQNLKASLGDDEWLTFFQLASRALSALEHNESISPSLKNELQQKINALNVWDVLKSFSIATHHSSKKNGWYLMRLNLEARTILSTYYTKALLEVAIEDYRRQEQEIAEDSTQDVVLVSADSLAKLKQSYPNYFADTRTFITQLQQMV